MATILVVDDRATNREFLMTLLGYGGHRMLEASDGAQGLAIARAKHPDLIIVDIVMPSMDGYEFVRELRSDPEIAQTPVIFYTASYLESEARTLAETCGVHFIITKPAEPEEILRKVKAVLGAPKEREVVLPEREFDREHLRLVTNKLSKKVDELEALTAALEERVARRTAELEKANTRLRELDKVKNDFLAIVSHDLRSPLTGILLGVEMMARKGTKMAPAMRKKILEQIVQSVQQQGSLANDLLTLARTESGSLQLKLSEFRLSEAARESIDTISLNANAKGVTIDVDLAPNEPALCADRSCLVQLFNNLLTNAIKFTSAGGRVTIKIWPASDSIMASVSDTGIGIPGEELPHLFEKFTGSRKGTGGETGTGLGLAIVQQIAERHGGTITVQSAPAAGATFTLQLPLHTAAKVKS